MLDSSSIAAGILGTPCFDMRVVLIRKLANRLDGVDVSDRQVGDVLDLPADDARTLVAERWAISDRRRDHIRALGPQRRRAADAEASPAPSADGASASRAQHAGGALLESSRCDDTARSDR